MNSDQFWRDRHRLLVQNLHAAAVSCEIYAPCDEIAVAEAAARARSLLGSELPADYLALLRLTDGLSCNGGLIYGSSVSAMSNSVDRYDPNASAYTYMHLGIIERNLELRASGISTAGSIVVGENDLEYFRWDSVNHMASFVGKISGESHEVFDTCITMLKQVVPPIIIECLGLSDET
jgi:hypothetical protein